MAAPSNNLIDSSLPATMAASVTPSDSANLPSVARALYVGGAGNVAVVFPDGDVVTFYSVSSGSFLPVRAKRVNFTNTTATYIVALY